MTYEREKQFLDLFDLGAPVNKNYGRHYTAVHNRVKAFLDDCEPADRSYLMRQHWSLLEQLAMLYDGFKDQKESGE